jgi:hypothetical protein
MFVLAVDFDGTVVKHKYPKVGTDLPLAVGYLRKFVDLGAAIVLSTMRGDAETHLDAAVKWFADREIPLYGVNRNPEQGWTTSPKVDCHAIIDDRAIGCPVIVDPAGFEAPYVDWETAGPMILRLIEAHNAG